MSASGTSTLKTYITAATIGARALQALREEK